MVGPCSIHDAEAALEDANRRLRDAEARFVERHPDVVAARRDLAAFEERARAEFHAKMRELFGEPAADAAE